ncbi:response regulator [bacterium]|nr:response regulator [bacterium]
MKRIKPVRVLICDDDAGDRKLLKTILDAMRNYTFDILEASTTEDIDRSLNSENLDLIFLDLLLPGKSGMEWLSTIVEKRIAPTVVITGHSELENHMTAMRNGAYGYISKPWISKLESALPLVTRAVTQALDQWEFEQLLEEQKKKLKK